MPQLADPSLPRCRYFLLPQLSLRLQLPSGARSGPGSREGGCFMASKERTRPSQSAGQTQEATEGR